MAGDISVIDQLRRRAAERQRAAAEAAEGKPSTGDGTAVPPPAPAPAPVPEEKEPAVNEVAYGYYRGIHERATHIEFQLLSDPRWPAPGYAWLPCPVWWPSGDGEGRGQAIVLKYITGLTVTVYGINLRSMYERILRQQVFRISEMGEEATAHVPSETAVVYKIDVDEAEEEGIKAAAGRRRQSG